MAARMKAGALRFGAGLWVTACGGAAASDGGVPALADSSVDGGETLEPGESLGPPVPLGGDDPCPPQPLTLADTLAALLADVQTQPGSSRPCLRYVSVGQFRQGPCDSDEGATVLGASSLARAWR